MSIQAFACYNKNLKIRLASSSGGIYTLLAESVIESGGQVYAACYNEKFEVEYKKISNTQDIKKTRGAKYISSRLGDTFQRVYNDLKEEKIVMFVGLPCQCAGLQLFLKMKKNANITKTLLLIDMICHGISGEKTWNMFIKEEEREKNSKLLAVNMRDKSSGWLGYQWRLDFLNGIVDLKHHDRNLYMKGYKNNLFLRPSCYKCNFKGISRLTDLTLGDFWGADRIVPELFDNKGVSVVLLHSSKGQEFFDRIKEQMFWKTIDIEQVIQSNRSIIESPIRSTDRTLFFKRLEEKQNFHKVVKKMTKDPFVKQVNNLIVHIKKKIKRALDESCIKA